MYVGLNCQLAGKHHSFVCGVISLSFPPLTMLKFPSRCLPTSERPQRLPPGAWRIPAVRFGVFWNEGNYFGLPNPC